MATTFSNRYISAGVPTSGRPLSKNTGPNDDYVEASYATTDLDGTDDIKYLLPVQCGKEIVFLDITGSTDMDTGSTLDQDLYLRTTDKLGAHTDTLLFNAGAFFQSAQAAGAVYRVWCTEPVPNSASGAGHIISKNVAAATTPVAGSFNLFAKVQ